MMRFFSLTLLSLLAVVVAIRDLPDVSGHLDRALEEIRESLGVVQKYVRKKGYNKRVTPSSRSMSLRNKVVKRTVARLKKEGLNGAHASSLVQRALQKHGMRPAGFGAFLGSLQPGKGGFGKGIETSSGFELPTFSCDRTPICNASALFRTITGECNNLANPLFGAVDIPFRRFLAPVYNDGLSIPRGGLTTLEDIEQTEETEETEEPEEPEEPEDIERGGSMGGGKGKGGKGKGGKGKGKGASTCPVALPLPRFISTQFFPDTNAPSLDISHMFMQMGQFIDHDLTLTPEEEVEECCENPSENGCFPVVLPLNDSFYSQFSQNCFQFTRSVPFCEVDGGVRQQFNADTGFLDSSNVYGSQDAMAALLRSNVNGLLAVNSNFPAIPGILPALGPGGTLLAGDIRVDEQPGLTTIHNLFLAEHNRLAREIFAASPTLTDEVIYQIARQLVNAQWQNIIYTEWLPILLGPAAMINFNLALPANRGTFTVYNPTVDASIVNAFATAAFRFGHSMIQGSFNLNSVTSPATTLSSFPLCANFNNNAIFLSNGAEGALQILAGLINQPAQTVDRSITSNLTNHLLPTAPNVGSFGMDLMARNIQRGRDHGLPPYNSYREFCGLSPILSFDSSSRPADISASNFALLATIYSAPCQIDLWVGGLAETPVFGGLTGPTFNCIKATQFSRLRDGDRFFFAHGGAPTSFSEAGLIQLRGRTMRDIICCNSPFPSVRVNSFMNGGALLPCGAAAGNPLNVSLFLPGAAPAPAPVPVPGPVPVPAPVPTAAPVVPVE